MSFSPNDTPLSDNASSIKDTSFGGQRQFTKGKQTKDQDYTKKSGGSPNVKENPVDEVVRDIDEMTEPESRKREFSRRAETASHKDHNKEHFHETDPENRPFEDSSNLIIPDGKKHGDKLRNQYGEGQYEGEIR